MGDYSQAESNCGDHQPIVFLKKNNHKPLVLVEQIILLNYTRTRDDNFFHTDT